MSFAKKHRPAEELLRSYGIAQPNEIDLEAIAHCEGVQVRYRELKGYEARLVGFEDKAIATITTNTLPTRQRFSLGHELGHWHHHRGKSFECRVNEDDVTYAQKTIEERIADEYSADLLLPTYMFLPLAVQYSILGFNDIESLANIFGTSVTSTAFRFIDSNVFPCMLVCHSPGGRKWFKSARDIPKKWFPKDQLDADSFALDALYKGREQKKPNKIGAESWFDRYDAERYDIYEHSKKFGEVVYTLLSFDDGDMLEEY